MSDLETLDYLDEIAIVGMTCRFPGAKNITEFWQNLRNGMESISFFSDQELEAAGISPETIQAPNYVKAKPILEDIEYFDATFFKINPKEAELIDPQQRLFLECAWEALENAGYASDGYRGQIGVYAGVDTNTYLLFNVINQPSAVGSTLQIITTNDKDYLSTRVSYKLNLRGPSITVQTACSTSMVAIHLACESLLHYGCDLALAGGVTVNVPHKNGYFYDKGGVASPDGHCRVFEARSRGTVFGSGVGIVVLKRLAEAVADGDAIHAVIKGTAINNDGSQKAGYTAPSVRGQMAVIAEALDVAEVNPEMISYVEAHGTGTELGDPIEVTALTEAFRLKTTKKGFCALGSVKTNMGHLAAAAGVAGVIKTALALEHREIPPILHFEQPNPQIDFANSPFYVNTQLIQWTAPSPRRAGVSSFGMGGTNAHLILEEGPEAQPTSPSRPYQLLLMSAHTETALDKMSDNLAAHLQAHPELNLPEVAYTLQVGRQAFEKRRILVTETLSQAVTALAQGDSTWLYTGEQVKPDRPVVFMFSGQGSQYLQMGRGLYEHEAKFREEVDRCANLLQPYLGLDLRGVMYPPEKEAEQGQERLGQTQLAQPALFVIEYALAQLWLSWGVRPVAMIGHSIGEYVAACLAGVFSLKDALKLVAKRGQLMQQMPPGAMTSVLLSEKELQPWLSGSLTIAAVNAPGRCVVAGPIEEVEALEQQLSQQEIVARRLFTSHAFHSAMMEPILRPYEEQVRQVALQAPRIPYLSNLTGTWIKPEEATDPTYWSRHLRHPVRFGQGIQVLNQTPDQVLLEVGPGRALLSLAQAQPDRSVEQVILASLRQAAEETPDEAVLLRTLGRLWLTGVNIDWSAFYQNEQRRRVPLPTYPFERQRYWLEPGDEGHRKSEKLLSKRPDMADWFYTPSWKCIMPPLLKEEITSGRWLVFAQADSLSEQLCARLAERGYEIIRVLSGEQFSTTGHTYSLRPAQREDYTTLFQQLVQANQLPTGIVHLWNVSSLGDNHGSEELLNRSFYSLLFLVQALSEQTISDLQLVTISNYIHEINGEEVIQPEKATLLGLCKVARQEMPQLACRCIDIVAPQAGSPQEVQLIECLLAELEAKTSDLTIAYRGDKRWVQLYEPAPLTKASKSLEHKLRVGGIYLITGGLGGIGLTLARYLASDFQARLILTTRSPFPPTEMWQQWLTTHAPQDQTSLRIQMAQDLIDLGGEVLVVQADVSDQAQMEAVVQLAGQRFGTLHGVIHAAGVPGGGIIPLKTQEAAARVLQPKVQGTRSLASALAHTPLDFFLLCSSLVTATGGMGQVDYCAANAYMDAFATAKSKLNGYRTVSIGWDAWTEVGMAVNTPPDYAGSQRPSPQAHLSLDHSLLEAVIQESEQRTEPSSLRDFNYAIHPTEGMEVFQRILCWNRSPQIIVSTRSLPELIEQAQIFDVERLSEASKTNGRVRHARPNLSTPYAAPSNEVEEKLAVIWQETLNMEQVGIHDSFSELGGDSLISLNIIQKAKQVGLNFTPQQFFQHQTIAELAQIKNVAPLEVEQTLIVGEIPLTSSQEWLLKGGTNYKRGNWSNIYPFAIPLALLPNPSLLEQTTRYIWRHHDQLRARFVQDDIQWRQFIDDPNKTTAPFYYIDLSELNPAIYETAIQTISDDFQIHLDLAAGPIFRVALFYLGQYLPLRLIIVIHHLAADGVSTFILLEDFITAYSQVLRGEAIRLPLKTMSVEQWVKALRNYAQSLEMRQEMDDYWSKLPWKQITLLPLDFPENQGQCVMETSDAVMISLSAEETEVLQTELPRRYNVGVLEALLMAVLQTITQWTGQPYLLLNILGTGRDVLPEASQADVSRTVCWTTLVRLLLLKQVKNDQPEEIFLSVLEQLRHIPNKGYGFDLLHRYGDEEIKQKMRLIHPDGKDSVQIIYHGNVDRQTDNDSFIQPVSKPNLIPHDPQAKDLRSLFTLRGQILNNRFMAHWEYNRSVFKRATVEKIVDDFVKTLRSLIAQISSSKEY